MYRKCIHIYIYTYSHIHICKRGNTPLAQRGQHLALFSCMNVCHIQLRPRTSCRTATLNEQRFRISSNL